VVQVLTKCDLVEGEVLEKYLTPSGQSPALPARSPTAAAANAPPRTQVTSSLES